MTRNELETLKVYETFRVWSEPARVSGRLQRNVKLSIDDSILNLPGMVKRMPGDAAHEGAG